VQPVERPAPEGQAEVLRVGQCRGEDLGDLLGRVSGGAAGPGHVLQPVGALGVEPPQPGVDGGPGDAEAAGDGGGAEALGGGPDDVGPLDEPGLGGAGVRERLDGQPLLGGQLTE
jgi:hypothetical protein